MTERNLDMLDVGEGFPAMPVEHFFNADKACPPDRRCLLQVYLPQRVQVPTARRSPGAAKIYAWRNSLLFSFYGPDHASVMSKANRFMLEQLRREARRTGAIAARRKGRGAQAKLKSKIQGGE